MAETLTAVFLSPAAVWAGIGALFLVLELISGSGWLLWPAAAAAVASAGAALGLLGPPAQPAAFAIQTALFTLAGRRWLARRRTHHHRPDLSDPGELLVGRTGEATTPFTNGRGRVFVSGKEWAADLSGAADCAAGTPVRVLGLLSSSRLAVTCVDAGAQV